MRQRFHFWLCDVLNLVSQDYFIEFCETMDKYLYQQDMFNRVVGNKLRLQKPGTEIKPDTKEAEERGMFG